MFHLHKWNIIADKYYTKDKIEDFSIETWISDISYEVRIYHKYSCSKCNKTKIKLQRVLNVKVSNIEGVEKELQEQGYRLSSLDGFS